MSIDSPIPYSSEESSSALERVFLAQQAGDSEAFHAALEELPEEEQERVRKFFSYSPADGVSVVY